MPPNPRRTAPSSSRPPAPLRREDATLGDEASPDERPRSRPDSQRAELQSQAQAGCEMEMQRGIGAGAFRGVGLGIRNVG